MYFYIYSYIRSSARGAYLKPSSKEAYGRVELMSLERGLIYKFIPKFHIFTEGLFLGSCPHALTAW